MDQRENLSKKKKRYNRILIIAFVGMIAIMLVSGIVLFRGVYTALGGFASEQISLEARSTAQMFSRVAMTKLERLQYIGNILENEPSKINDILSASASWRGNGPPRLTWTILPSSERPWIVRCF